jgi:nicotinamidase-related amidase|tara:strand:+ start:11813 stop:12400 length:588 start_codon:yes stop_codon:yes gene_type:complete
VVICYSQSIVNKQEQLVLVQQDTGLIVIDVQGKLARLVDNSDAMINSIATMIRAMQTLGIPVLFVEQLPDKLGATVEELNQFIPAGEAFAKATFSALRTEGIEQQVKALNRSQWLVCGIEAHICVYQTVIDLLASGKQVHLLSDCVSSRNPANKQLALQKMQSAGAQLTGVEMALFELLERADTEQFKSILPLIK